MYNPASGLQMKFIESHDYDVFFGRGAWHFIGNPQFAANKNGRQAKLHTKADESEKMDRVIQQPKKH